MIVMTEKIVGMAKPNIIKSKPIFMSLLINIVLYALAVIFCDFKYEISDDFVVEGILSGAYSGTTDPHLLFSNILLGYFLKFFYDVFPNISFYFVFLELTGFLSLVAIVYCLLKKMGSKTGLLIAVVFVMFFSDDLYIIPTFTKTAAAASVAGGVLFLMILWDFSAKKIPQLLLAVYLLLSGMLLRHKCFLMMIPLLFVVYVVETIRRIRLSPSNDRKVQIKKSCIVFTGCLLVVLAAFGFSSINSYLWARDGGMYSEYKRFNELRAGVTDTVDLGYDSISDTYEELGFSYREYYIVNSWGFLDRSIFDNNSLESIASAKKEASYDIYHSFDGINQKMIQRGYSGYAIVIGLFILGGILIFMNPRNTLPVLLCTTAGFLLLWMTFYNGRYLYRLEYGIVFATVAACLFVSTPGEAKDNKKFISSLAAIASLVFLFRLPLYYKDTSYKSMTSAEYQSYVWSYLWHSGTYMPNKYRVYVDEDNMCAELYERIYSDSDHYYLFDFNSTIQKTFYGYNPWIRVPAGEWRDNYSYFGGVTTMYPGNMEAWSSNGIDPYNPFADLVNENIYVVDNGDINVKLKYLQWYYYPYARVELVDTVDGFNIWKFYEE